MSDEELVHEYAAKVSKGEITFDKVRPLLEQQGIDETRVTQIVRKVDDEIQAALLTQSTTSSLEKVIRFGIILIVFGVIVTLGSFAGFLSVGNGYMAVFGYGPIVAGLVMIVVGIRRKKNMAPGSETLKRTFRVRDKESGKKL